MGGGIPLSLCTLVRLFVCLSAGFVQKISSEQFILLYPNLIWWCIVRRRCHAQELGCYLQGQGHNKGLYNHNMPVSTISSELMGVLLFFATELSLLVDHYKPKAALKMCYCCVTGQGHSKGSKFNLMFVRMVLSETLKL